MWVTYRTHPSIFAQRDKGILASLDCPTRAEGPHPFPGDWGSLRIGRVRYGTALGGLAQSPSGPSNGRPMSQ
jgi:hypothetical protein